MCAIHFYYDDATSPHLLTLTQVWNFTGVISSKVAERPVDPNVPMDRFSLRPHCKGIVWFSHETTMQIIRESSGKSPRLPEWFPGARLNYAENLLRSVEMLILIKSDFLHPKTNSFS